MLDIRLARVDDRLIHGQVMTAWLQYTGGKRIVIVDDGTAADEFTKTIISMAVPNTCELKIFGVSDAGEFLKASDDTPTILLAKTPEAFLDLLNAGIEIKEVIVGGMGANKDRTKLYKNIAASEKERQTLSELISKGVDVKIQVIPDQKSVKIEDLL